MTERKLKAEDIAMIAGWINPYRTHLADLIHDLEAAEALAQRFENTLGEAQRECLESDAELEKLEAEISALRLSRLLFVPGKPMYHELKAEVERLRGVEKREAEHDCCKWLDGWIELYESDGPADGKAKGFVDWMNRQPMSGGG